MMKRISATSMILICMFTLIACSVTPTKGDTLLKSGTVLTVSVSSLPEGFNYSFSGDTAQSVIDYISKLSLISDYEERPDEYTGMTWVILLEYNDGSNLTVYHFGNMFIRAEDGPWYKMSYQEASQLDTLFYELSH